MAVKSSSKKIELEQLLPLEADFYARNTLEVAPDLLGKILFVKTKEGVTAGRIVETEAYRADDPASHSSRGKTPRAAIMFGDPARVYVYFIYGMYEMLNFVTEPDGDAGAVLIRAVEPVRGEDLMKRRRKTARTRHDLSSGPGKLCRAMGVQMNHNGLSLQGPTYWVVDDGFEVGEIRESPRVGITQGKESLWRYFLSENEFVSRSPLNSQSRQFEKR